TSCLCESSLVVSSVTPPSLITPLSPHDALPIWQRPQHPQPVLRRHPRPATGTTDRLLVPAAAADMGAHVLHDPQHRHVHLLEHRSEEHTSELQSRENLV